MYTVVPRTEVVEHRPRPGEPALEIIDHREQQPQNLRTKKKRPEQLPYDTLKTQRDSMFQKELKYKKRIEDLEKDSKELLQTYENTYEENSKLKRLLENGPDAVKLKQLSKVKKEQKGLIDHLKDDNQLLQEKMVQLEREVQAEKLKSHERSWDVQLRKVKKKRQEEDAIPTEGPFVGGQIAKPKRLSLLDDEGEHELDAYDLQVDTLEKEAKVLLNKVKILKREKDQIDYANLMGKGAVTKNKTVAKAINDKLNRDLNKFVIRLQMLKMKQNAARTYCNLMTDESNPVIQLKASGSGQASPDRSKGESRRSNRSWKASGEPTPTVTNGNNKTRSESNVSGKQSNVSGKQEMSLKNGDISSRRSSYAKMQENGSSRRPSNAMVQENDIRKKPAPGTTQNKNVKSNNANNIAPKNPNSPAEKRTLKTAQDKNMNKNGVEVTKPASPKQKPENITVRNKGMQRHIPNAAKPTAAKAKANDQVPVSNKQNQPKIETSDGDTSAQIWERVQSSRLPSRNAETRLLPENDNRSVQKNDQKNKREPTPKRNTNGHPTKTDDKSSKSKGDVSKSATNNKPSVSVVDNKSKQKSVKPTKLESESAGRYAHGPEPIGRKGLAKKKNAENVQDDEPTIYEKASSRKQGMLVKNGLMGSDSTTQYNHTHGHMYRINGPDDAGFNLVKLNDQLQRTDRGVRARPVPINFNTKKSFDVRENKSIIGNTGIRNDAFFRQLNDGDPYFGL